MQGAFLEPGVVFYAVFKQIVVKSGDILGQRKLNQRGAPLSLVLFHIAVAVFFGKSLGVGNNVVAVVRVLRHFNPVAVKLLIAQVEGKPEFVYLISGVVDIKFALGLKACRRKNGRKRVSQSAAAGVAYVHRSGRICGNKFNQNPLSAAEIAFAVVRALFLDIAENFRIIRIV